MAITFVPLFRFISALWMCEIIPINKSLVNVHVPEFRECSWLVRKWAVGVRSRWYTNSRSVMSWYSRVDIKCDLTWSAYSEHWAFVKMPGLWCIVSPWLIYLACIDSPWLIYLLRSVYYCHSRLGWTQTRLGACLIIDWFIYTNCCILVLAVTNSTWHTSYLFDQ